MIIYLFDYISDTTMERNTLMAQCYPKLKDYCREKHGLEFQVGLPSRKTIIWHIDIDSLANWCIYIKYELYILDREIDFFAVPGTDNIYDSTSSFHVNSW